ncbi:uncharacterized membrane protein YcaP (DUF421 family) [Natranaerovirga pectinivora]|uniref:Uncharacterized membrane protein YcaP (DUF421 family) n=1 Tax=Natranaerovirga pectinivora TaxID=682400 RepID=A0A4R3MS00_9FIRM|nr:YetF domain-containing protein [Natranaerovirga pectinivora]TCT16198.1 uncharacterized membrane protein YcaP (DUF421 family) [Natranaerovirga pectinivora]
MLEVISDSLILLTVGVLLLRLAGRKSISQLTIPQTIIMISIGNLIIQPIVETSVWKTIVGASTFIAFLLVMEVGQVKYNWVEKLLKGHAVIVIEDGKLNATNLKKIRMTVDQLEVRLRQQGVKDIKDAKIVTCEANGQIGVELIREAQPLTIGEFEKLMAKYITKEANPQEEIAPLFDELVNPRKHYPEYLE